MKHLWVKTSTEVFEDGGKSIQYTCEDFPGVTITELESRGTAVPCALVIAEDEEES